MSTQRVFMLLAVLLAVTLCLSAGPPAGRATAAGVVQASQYLPLLGTAPPASSLIAFPATDQSTYVYGADRDADGNVLFVGSAPVADAAALKVDRTGRPRWAAVYRAPEWDFFRTGLLTAGGGAVVAGATKSFGAGDVDIWVLELDARGDVLWNTVIGTPDTEGNYPLALVPAAGGSYFLVAETPTGSPTSDALLIRLSATGDLLWQKAIGGPGAETAHAAVAYGSGLLFAGETEGSGPVDGTWLVEVDADGELLRQQVASGGCEVLSLSARTGGGAIVAGRSDDGACVLVFGPGLTYLWGQQFAGGDWEDRFNGALSLADGGVLVAGMSEAPGSTSYGPWAVRFSAQGNLIWQKHYLEVPTTSRFTLRAALAAEADGLWLVGTSLGSDYPPCSSTPGRTGISTIAPRCMTLPGWQPPFQRRLQKSVSPAATPRWR